MELGRSVLAFGSPESGVVGESHAASRATHTNAKGKVFIASSTEPYERTTV
jgi:hypothetical protein